MADLHISFENGSAISKGGGCTEASKIDARSPDASRRLSQKITLGEMRASGARLLMVQCPEYKCSRSIVVNADPWSDDVRLSDLEHHLVCKSCGRPGADVRPHFGYVGRMRAKALPWR